MDCGTISSGPPVDYQKLEGMAYAELGVPRFCCAWPSTAWPSWPQLCTATWIQSATSLHFQTRTAAWIQPCTTVQSLLFLDKLLHARCPMPPHTTSSTLMPDPRPKLPPRCSCCWPCRSSPGRAPVVQIQSGAQGEFDIPELQCGLWMSVQKKHF